MWWKQWRWCVRYPWWQLTVQTSTVFVALSSVVPVYIHSFGSFQSPNDLAMSPRETLSKALFPFCAVSEFTILNNTIEYRFHCFSAKLMSTSRVWSPSSKIYHLSPNALHHTLDNYDSSVIRRSWSVECSECCGFWLVEGLPEFFFVAYIFINIMFCLFVASSDAMRGSLTAYRIRMNFFYHFYYFVINVQHIKQKLIERGIQKWNTAFTFTQLGLVNLNTTHDQPHNHPFARPPQKGTSSPACRSSFQWQTVN